MKQNQLWAITAGIWTFFVVIIIGGILYYTNVYTVSGTLQLFHKSKEAKVVEKQEEIEKEDFVYFPLERKNESETIQLQLPQNVKEGDVFIENDFLNQCVYLYINSSDSHFYEKDRSILATEQLENAFYSRGKSKDVFLLSMDAVYEYYFDIKNSVLMISTNSPHQIYSKVLALDVVCEDEIIRKQILDASRVGLESENIRLYAFESENNQEKENHVLNFLDKSEVDFYIRLYVGNGQEDFAPKEDGMVAYYQNHYYQEENGSIQLADLVLKQIAGQTGTAAIGLEEPKASMDYLNRTGVSSCAIYLGNLKNGDDRVMLQSELFSEKLVTALQKAITELLNQDSLDKAGD